MASALDFPLNWFPEDQPRPIEGEYRAGDAGLAVLDADVHLVSPLRLGGEGYRQRDEVCVTLHVAVDATYVCGRCLDPIAGHLETEFTVVYRPIAQRPPYLEAEDEAGLSYYESGIIAVGDDIRRYLLLELPIWPVCSSDCAGLCPHCGANQNREQCDCAREHDGQRQTELARKLDQLLP